jgi:ADP-ribose pyrophosphatase
MSTAAEILYRGKYLLLKRRGTWEYAERVNPQGAVVIIAVTPEDKVLLVEQYRIPIQSRTLEFPAGLIGDQAHCAGEGWMESARRELLEETGWEPRQLELVMVGPSSAGMSTELMHFVRARDLVRIHAGGGHAGEDITVHEVPRREIAAFVARHMHQGYAIDAKVYAGIYFLDHDVAGNPV